MWKIRHNEVRRVHTDVFTGGPPPERPRPRRRRRRIKLAPRFWALLAAVVIIYVGSAYAVGFLKIHALHRQIAEAEQTLARIEAENERLRRELEYINSDEYIEAIARQQLGLVYPGETAVVLVKTDADADPVATQRLSSGWTAPSDQ